VAVAKGSREQGWIAEPLDRRGMRCRSGLTGGDQVCCRALDVVCQFSFETP
jgi:hypothetical protein